MAAGKRNIEAENINASRWYGNILVTGKTGVGKSRLVSALVGQSQEQIEDTGVCNLAHYEATIEDVKVTVWDSPGLQDGTSNEDQYIQAMRDKIKNISLMIYCIKMDDNRFYEADKKVIKTLTDEFGKEVWSHAVVVLTFANKIEDPDGEDESEYFKRQIHIWKKQFKDYFADVGLKPEMCGSIPVIPAGNRKNMRLPDRENWLSDLWIVCYQVMKASARRGTYQINKNRKIPLNEDQQESFLRSTWDAFVSYAPGMESLSRVGRMVLNSIFPNVFDNPATDQQQQSIEKIKSST